MQPVPLLFWNSQNSSTCIGDKKSSFPVLIGFSRPLPLYRHMHQLAEVFFPVLIGFSRPPPLYPDTGGSLPKFGDWDPNDPTSAENFTARFNKAKDEKKTGHIDDQGSNSPANELSGKHELIIRLVSVLTCMVSYNHCFYILSLQCPHNHFLQLPAVPDDLRQALFFPSILDGLSPHSQPCRLPFHSPSSHPLQPPSPLLFIHSLAQTSFTNRWPQAASSPVEHLRSRQRNRRLFPSMRVALGS
ncbi:RPM1-interacting protein 4 [Platanthera guangdongensis]|uniref:RPM1-interacting protein 4 n=1 Tax=Platanthera guangdongensis TaxID=2320717 RepID=A0ABR2MK49_9ASPA